MFRLDDRILSWLPPEEIESEARRQLENVASLPVVFRHVAVMPDCHLGKGATVGTVIATERAIIPAAVGVDIGCGMVAVRTALVPGDLPRDLARLRAGIERRIPLSAGKYNRRLTGSARARVATLREEAGADYAAVDRHWELQLGSLGSGNHFIEVCLDQGDRVWVVLHSGSRGIGNRLAKHHIRIARELIERQGVSLPDRDLGWLPEGTREFAAYARDLDWAQHFALLNREEMMDRCLTELSWQVHGEGGHEGEIELERINCHHNFAQRERHFGHDVWITRKGAIEMREGQPGIIPGSMGTRTYIVSGRGNEPSYRSAPHGAGRRFSRGEARRRFTMDDFAAAMGAIEYRHSSALLDEVPMAYKDIDQVIAYSQDLVRVEHTLRQIVNVKGD